MTNAEFAQNDVLFLNACNKVELFNTKSKKLAILKASKRQASKWRHEKGIAWKEGRRGQK